MASAQVDDAQVEEFLKPCEETTLGSPTIEGSEKAPAPENIKSPYDEDDEEDEVILPDELTKQEDLDDEDDQKALSPQTIEDKDDEDEDDDDEPALKSAAGRASDYSEEEGDDDV
ncbi:uncharacterized protein LOC143606761 [Bidens hawaiensis]|uniref:uncharacterized protein LOC143606761 n=1 Tax=Bidens hawaiensis TaxID=980011 RepID=UPI00404B33A6